MISEEKQKRLDRLVSVLAEANTLARNLCAPDDALELLRRATGAVTFVGNYEDVTKPSQLSAPVNLSASPDEAAAIRKRQAEDDAEIRRRNALMESGNRGKGKL